MKTIFIFLVIILFNTMLLSYEYNFTDSTGQKGLFQNSLPFSKNIENCINKLSFTSNYLLKNNREFLYVEDSNLVLNDCNKNTSTIKKFQKDIESKIVFKNKLYLNVNHSVWVSDGTKDGTYILKKDLNIFSFNTSNYNLYILSYPGMDELEMYTIDEKNKTLKRILKGISISTSRFAHFGTPFLYITRYGTLFRMNEINFEIEIINDQPLVYYPSFLVPMGEKLLHFVSEKGEIFVTNGTKEGTQKIKSFRNTRKDIYFKVETAYDNKIVFLTQDINKNENMYETDGTKEGTTFLKKVDD